MTFLQKLLRTWCSALLLSGGAALTAFPLASMMGYTLLGNGLAAVGLILLAAGCFGLSHMLRSLNQTMTALEANLAESVDQLGRDPLTGQLNRSAFNTVLTQLSETNATNSMVMLIFFDLNRFKDVNDTLGHDIGDQLLRQVAERAAEVMPDTLAFARFGGDEFAALVPYSGEASAKQLGGTLVERIGSPYKLGGKRVEVSASVGIAIGDPAIHGGEELLRRSDLAMYEAKGVAKGAFHIFDNFLSQRQMRENTIRAELGKTEFAKRFVLHYQPIMDARSGRIDKAEALLRPNGETLSGISPLQMVEVAEDSGQIVRLTDWTIDEALATSKRLSLPVAVNISPIYFRRSGFADRVIEKLITFGVAPQQLTLEITERVLIADMASTRESVDHLRAVGLKVWHDDFGTGYSSLSYLKSFDLDGLKLDRSFIHNIGRNEKSLRIIRSIIDFAHSLGMKAVIEGVESDWQARMLQLQGCDYLQGFFLGMPTLPEELARTLAENRAESETEALSRAV